MPSRGHVKPRRGISVSSRWGWGPSANEESWQEVIGVVVVTHGQLPIERVRGEAGVLVLTDMFGGTPSNLGMTFLEKDRIEVITGVNLPMLIKLAQLPQSQDLLAVARQMRDDGRNAIWVASDLLRGEKV